jgi:hypothetical protein
MKFISKGVLAVVMAAAVLVAAEARAEESARTEIYGFVMMDAGYNSMAIDPEWFDVQRPTKLEAFEGQFGEDGETFFSVRQTRLGVKSYLPTDMGELFTQFEFEMFGTGVDAGQTTIRLRHAYGELGQFGAGQYWSPFMDIDVFPNTVEYWGPNGMAFFRNVQFRWMPVKGESRVTFALERPGASGDQGDYSDRLELSDIRGKFPVPDLSAEARLGRGWGYVEAAGIVRRIEWEDLNDDGVDLSDGVTAWGLSGSSNLKFGGSTTARLQVVVGEGIQNYMNDAPVDVAIESDDSEEAGFKGVAIPMVGISAFIDHSWSSKFSSSVGYSQLDIDNPDGQSASAFKLGQYALANIMYYPIANVMMGVEGGWIRRENFEDGFETDNTHVQFSFKYNFSTSIGTR